MIDCKFFWPVCVALSLFAANPTGLSAEEDPKGRAIVEKNVSEERRQEMIAETAKEWQSIFGPVDFTEEYFYELMLYAWPQPEDEMQEFGDRRLHPAIIAYSDMWMNIFFKPEYVPDVTTLRPNSYFLSGIYETDLLKYRWTATR